MRIASPLIVARGGAFSSRAVYAVMAVHDADSAPDGAAPLADPLAAAWPQVLLLAVAIGYGTNFPAGRLLNEALPAAAVTSGRFALAAAALSPFLPRLRRELVTPALACGVCDAIGYIAQSLALVDTPAAKVSFLGALTVVWVPLLAAALGGRDLGPRTAPQVWLAALLTLGGVGALELRGSLAALGGAPSAGDVWAVVQAMGFGTSFFLVERMMSGAIGGADGGANCAPPSAADQALPVTAVLAATTAACSALWAVADGLGLGLFAASPSAGWLLDAAQRDACTLPGVLLGPTGAALGWTGLATTAAVRVGETAALGRVDASSASVIVATEPLWAAAFGVLLLHESLGTPDVIGGALMILACCVSTADPEAVRRALPFLPGPEGARAAEKAEADSLHGPR
jgi:drug/metabolite transporter (DMT)-like permease